MLTEIETKTIDFLAEEIKNHDRIQHLSLRIYISAGIFVSSVMVLLDSFGKDAVQMQRIGELILIGILGVAAHAAVMIKRAGIYKGMLEKRAVNPTLFQNLPTWEVWIGQQKFITKVLQPIALTLVYFPALCIPYLILGYGPWSILGTAWDVLVVLLLIFSVFVIWYMNTTHNKLLKSET